MIFAYPERPTVRPGQQVRLHYSSDRPKFAIDIFRQGKHTAPDWVMRVPSTGWFSGKSSPFRAGSEDHGWPFVDVAISANAAPGVYIANFSEADDNLGTNATSPSTDSPDGRSGKALFVVRSSVAGRPILLKLAWFTYNAYNKTNGSDPTSNGDPGESLYGSLNAAKTSLHRPGGGTGGETFDGLTDPDLGMPGDPIVMSPRQTFAHYEAPFIAWLESNGYAHSVDYCTDLDIEEDGSIVDGYRAIVSVGHDEYWTMNMRQSLVRYRDAGGNLALFSGNTHFRPLTYSSSDFSIARWGAPDHPTGSWREVTPPVDPENVLTGVSYSAAGGWWAPDRPAVGYTVQDPSHWVFADTGLVQGQIFGAADFLVGYEADGCVFADDGAGHLVPTGSDSTPTDFRILGVGATAGWSIEDPVETSDRQAATLGVYDRGGTVFTAGTTDWGRVLGKGSADSRAVLGRITRNVLDRLAQIPLGQPTLATFDAILAVDGFYSSDDDFRHAIVVTADSTLWEIFFHPDKGQGQAQLEAPGALGTIRDIGAFYTDDDRYRHVIVAAVDGRVWEVFYNPGTGEGQTVIGTFDDIVAVSGFYSADDHYRHAIVATSNGEVTELFFHPSTGTGRVVLGNFSHVVDVGSFYSADDHYRHAIVATADGDVTELFYHPSTGTGRALLGNFPGVTRVSAFYADNDPELRRRVLVTDDAGRSHEIRFGAAGEVEVTLRTYASGVVDIGGFFTSDDGYRHAIVATGDGSVRELFYKP